MKRYFFGYLFVKLAKIIAVLVLLAGIGEAAIRYVQGSLEASNIRYEPSKTLGSKLFSLEAEWQNTRNLITNFLGSPPGESVSPHFSGTPDTAAEFEALARQLATIQSQRASWKSDLVHKFEASVIEIEGKLRAHAASLNSQEPSTRQALPAEESKPVEEKEPATAKTLFDDLDRSDLDSRRDALKECSDLLAVLRTTVENPENDKILADALGQLDLLRGLLPQNMRAPEPSETSKSNPETLPAAQEKTRAEIVADKLRRARQMVRAAVLTEWSIDRASEQAMADAESERSRCIKSERELKSLWLSVGTAIVLTLVGAVLTTFLILVFADLTQAFLDSAVNSTIVASVYQNAPP